MEGYCEETWRGGAAVQPAGEVKESKKMSDLVEKVWLRKKVNNWW